MNVACYITDQRVMTDFMDILCAFCSHLFWISATTLYLADMTANVGSDLTYTGKDVMPGSVEYNDPISLYIANWSQNSILTNADTSFLINTPYQAYVPASKPYGNPLVLDSYLTDSFNNTITALGTIKTTLEKPLYSTAIPMNTTFPTPGTRVLITDDSFGHTLNVDMHIRNMHYDFHQGLINITGEAALT